MIGNTMSKEITSKSRYNNLWSKSIIVLFVLLTTIGIYWKKKRLLSKIPKCQRNVLTLKQTVAVIFLVYSNNLVCDYLLAFFPPTQFLFILEELRVLLVENIVIRFLLPVLLILNTRRTLPALWAEKDCERREFFMTKLNSQSDFPDSEALVVQEVPVVLEVQEVRGVHEAPVMQKVRVVQEGRKERHFIKDKNYRTSITTLANTATGSSLPEVSE